MTSVNAGPGSAPEKAKASTGPPAHATILGPSSPNAARTVQIDLTARASGPVRACRTRKRTSQVSGPSPGTRVTRLAGISVGRFGWPPRRSTRSR